MGRIAVWPCRLHLNGLGRSVDPPKHEVEPARAERLRSKVDAKIATQARDHRREVFPVADGLGEGEPPTDEFGRHERFKWLGGVPEPLVEPSSHVPAETTGERGARHGCELAD